MIFQQELVANMQKIPACKSHTASTENSLNLIPSNSLILDLVTDNS